MAASSNQQNQQKDKMDGDAAKRDRDFTKPNDDNGWSFPIIFYDTSNPSDTAETAPKKIVYVNRHSLANGSPVFEKIFFDPNYVDSSKSELVMSGGSFDDFLELINCIAVTYKSEKKKPIDIDNLERMLRFADYYQMGSLLERCEAFVAQLTPTLGIDDKENRLILGRLFGICHRTNNTALLPADIATKKISRFPLVEIRALDVDEQMQTSLLIAKMERYARLSHPPSMSLSAAICLHCRSPSVASRAHSASYYYCEYCGECIRYGSSASQDHRCHSSSVGRHSCYCECCGDVLWDTVTRQFAPDCPDCKQSFVFSAEADPDKCGCNL